MWISDDSPGFPQRDKVCAAFGPYRVLRDTGHTGFELVRLSYSAARCIEAESLGQHADFWSAFRDMTRRSGN